MLVDAEILRIDPRSVHPVEVRAQRVVQGPVVSFQYYPVAVVVFLPLVAKRIDMDLVPEQRTVDAELLRRREWYVDPDAQGHPEVTCCVLRVFLAEELDCGVLPT